MTAPPATDVATRLHVVQTRIARAVRDSGRTGDAVQLVAVAKTWPLDAVDAVATCGQRAFGENYAQEGISKASARPTLEWHFIGPLQSNKTRDIAEHFAWVHTIDRLKIAERLSAQRPATLPPLQLCVQVNISAETSKHGCPPDAALALCQAVARLPNVRLRGLMAIPKANIANASDDSAQRRQHAALRHLLAAINAADPTLALDTLSMGMSDDLEAAIAEGATLVRIGSAIFGPRLPVTPPTSES